MNRFIKQKQQLGIFITAGYPELESTEEQLSSIQDAGADFIEVGMPFSDPMADGPTIQKSSMIALKNGMNLKKMFSQLM
jgi:tryptophan synthase alpha chain